MENNQTHTGDAVPRHDLFTVFDRRSTDLPTEKCAIEIWLGGGWIACEWQADLGYLGTARTTARRFHSGFRAWAQNSAEFRYFCIPPTRKHLNKMATPNENPAPPNPLMAGCQQEPCSAGPLTAEMIREMLGHVPFDVGDMPDRWQWMANYLNETLRDPGVICPCCNITRDGQMMDHLPTLLDGSPVARVFPTTKTNHKHRGIVNDMECPYCDAPNKVCHDDGQGYKEDEAHEMPCGDCGKNFVFQTSISFYYSPKKADCLNGSPHRFREWLTLWDDEHETVEERRCRDCDHRERQERRKPSLANVKSQSAITAEGLPYPTCHH